MGGRGVSDIATIKQCQAIGEVLGRMHVTGQQFEQRQPTQRGAKWRQQKAENLLPLLDQTAAKLMRDELDFQANYATLDLPFGLTHSDLFRDNALFDGDKLKGIIDFY